MSLFLHILRLTHCGIINSVFLTNRPKSGKEVITIESHLHVYLSGKLENSIGN